MLLTAWSAGERREARVARSIWRFVCWCIRLEKVSCCYLGKGVCKGRRVEGESVE